MNHIKTSLVVLFSFAFTSSRAIKSASMPKSPPQRVSPRIELSPIETLDIIYFISKAEKKERNGELDPAPTVSSNRRGSVQVKMFTLQHLQFMSV